VATSVCSPLALTVDAANPNAAPGHLRPSWYIYSRRAYVGEWTVPNERDG
jgi:hypothetical protein